MEAYYDIDESGTAVRKTECGRCGALKPAGGWYCDPCRDNIHVLLLHATGTSTRDKYLLAHYGITHARYLEILAAQYGGCAICGKPPEGRNLDVDHCHKTGAVRGLLCMRCNQQLLPIAKDDSVLLRAAADYLERPSVGWAPMAEDLPPRLKGSLRKSRGTNRQLDELPKWMRGKP